MTPAALSAITWPTTDEFEIRTDGKTGIRHYRHQRGPWLVSSTTALDVIAKGYQFQNWIDDQRVDAYDSAIAKAILEPVAPEYLLATIKARMGSKRPYLAKRDAAAELGTEVDHAVRAYLVSQLKAETPPIPRLSPEGLVSFSTFVAWWLESGLTAVAMQQTVIEPEWGYAGTFDFAASRPDGSLGILDLKRTKWISNNYHYQVASYMRAARRYADVSWGAIVKLPKDGRPLEIRELGEGMFGGDRTEAECMEAFRCALALWRCENRLLVEPQ